MKQSPHITILVLVTLIFCMAAAEAGEIIIYEFKPGAPAAREVLAHVKVKGLVAELLDTADTGLGKSLGYLLWREVLTAISDQAGAGVILARPPGERRLTDLLKANYHQAALEIAEQQQARMLLWGAVDAAEDSVFISSYLTLMPDMIGADLALSLDIEGTTFSAGNPRSRFNFTPVEVSRKDLFSRSVVTRTSVRIWTEPHAEAPAGPRIPKNTALTAVDMQGPWFKVQLPTDGIGYVHQGSIALPPLSITADSAVNVRSGPGTDSGRRFRIAPGDRFPVLDMRYREGHGTWYRIERNGEPGWVAAWVVRPRYSLPGVMFVAGLYRFQSRNYDEAARSFEIFLRNAESTESNVIRAAAFQLLGASRLAGKKFEGARGFDALAHLSTFDQAVRLTPYDPAARNLRALGHLASGSLSDALTDLETSLELNRFNDTTYQLLDTLSALSQPSHPKYRLLEIYDFFQATDIERIKSVQKTFAPSRQLMKSLDSPARERLAPPSNLNVTPH